MLFFLKSVFFWFVFGFEGVFRAEFRADEMCSYLLFHLLSSGIPIQSVQTLKTVLLISGKEIIHRYFRQEAVVTTGVNPFSASDYRNSNTAAHFKNSLHPTIEKVSGCTPSLLTKSDWLHTITLSKK